MLPKTVPVKATVPCRCRVLFYLVTAVLALGLTTGCTATRFDVSFDRVDGLKQDDPVICDNTPVGRVKKITYTSDAAFLVSVVIPETFSGCATVDSRFNIAGAPDKPGTKALFIEKSRTGGKKIPNDAVVKGSDPPSPIASTAASLESLWQVMGEKIAELMARLETIPETDEYQAMKDAMAELENHIRTSGEKMGQILQNQMIPLLEEKINDLSKKLRKQGQEDKADCLEQDLKKLQDI